MTQTILRLAACLFMISVITVTQAGEGLAGLSSQALLAEARPLIELSEPDEATETRLEQIVLELAMRTPPADARALVESLATRQPQIMVRHEEGDIMMPRVDTGAAARYALRNWTRIAAFDKATRSTRTSDPRLLQDYFTADTAGQAGIIDAVNNSTRNDLVLYRDEVIRRMSEPGGDRLAAALAVALADTTLLEQVIIAGSASVALQTLGKLSSVCDADTTLALLQRATARTDLASAALFEVGRLTAGSPAAKQLLWDLLTHPEHGASAAAVLARHADNDTLNRLIELAYDGGSAMLRKRAVLALRLGRDARGRQIADELTEQWLASPTDTNYRR